MAKKFHTLLGDQRPFVIGLTGAFGSGCSTAAGYLEEFGYRRVKVSEMLERSWRRKNPGRGRPERSDLQTRGDELRERSGNHCLVEQVLTRELDAEPRPTHIVIDAIRNLGEVRWLQENLGERFALIALWADSNTRFQRSQQKYGNDLQRFRADEKRDQGEDEDWGQQVGRCVDSADVFLLNEDNLPDRLSRARHLKPKLERYAHLVESNSTDYPTPDEILMNIAFGASHSTKCLKRQVGAVIARGPEIIATGFNENPDGMPPCVEAFSGQCYRDLVRQEGIDQLVEDGVHCPYCSKQLVGPIAHPWLCPHCRAPLDAAFFPDKAMRWCTALHAEERAIINARGRDLAGTTLYTTTYPCTLCAEKIIHAGIRDVVFVDAYTDPHATVLLDQAGVQRRLFEGVRSRNFHRYYAGVQETAEKQAVTELRRDYHA